MATRCHDVYCQICPQISQIHGLGIVSRVSVRQGDEPLGLDRVTGEAWLRLYQATVRDYWTLDPESPFDVRVQSTFDHGNARQNSLARRTGLPEGSASPALRCDVLTRRLPTEVSLILRADDVDVSVVALMSGHR